MSSDGDFGSYATTTPAKPVTRNTRAVPRAAGPSTSSKPVAGSSKGSRKRARKTPEAQAEAITVVSTEDEEVDDRQSVEIVPPTRRTVVTNGKAPTKGKDRANNGAGVRGGGSSAHMDDGRQTVDESENEVAGRASRSQRKAVLARTSKDTSDLLKEMEDLRSRFKESETQRQQLSKQLDELFSMRNTEPESALRELTAVQEERVKALETLVKDLSSKDTAFGHLARPGKGPLLTFLTRDAADEEKREVVSELSRLNKVIQEKEAVIQTRDAKILECEQREKQLEKELALEIERSKTLAARGGGRGPPSAARGRTPASVLGSDSPKDTHVIKFYEDVTNLLVINVKFDQGAYHDLVRQEDIYFTCVYTSGSRPDEKKSLSFSLQFYYGTADEDDPDPDRTPISSPDQLTAWVRYTPLELDKESAEFIESIQYLSDPFKFSRAQLPVFMSSVYKVMSGEVAGAEEVSQAEDDEVMLIED